MTDIAWSTQTVSWEPTPQVRARRKLDAQAWHLARQFVNGTAPSECVIACPDEYSAAQLLERLKHYIQLMGGDV